MARTDLNPRLGGLHSFLEQANQALGSLEGLASVLPDLSLFIGLYIRKEALLSVDREHSVTALQRVADGNLWLRWPGYMPEDRFALLQHPEGVHLPDGRRTPSDAHRPEGQNEAIFAGPKIGGQDHRVQAVANLLALKRNHVSHCAAPLIEHASGDRPEFPVVILCPKSNQLILGDHDAFGRVDHELGWQVDRVAAMQPWDVAVDVLLHDPNAGNALERAARPPVDNLGKHLHPLPSLLIVHADLGERSDPADQRTRLGAARGR
ncbi:MAG: hypothetical protein K6T61_18445 [Bryobacteraceae bacterium]|nr:hypothetical protein [Bryobacteraceae bacterium]